MAAPGRRTDPSLEETLFDRGYEFEFFQAVRLLARLFPFRELVGGRARPEEEIARFGARLSMAFPASAIHDVERLPDSSSPARVTVAFLALTGTQGILPFFYTEYMLAHKPAEVSALAAFLDLFNHRLVSLFYRAWYKHQPPILYERAAVTRQLPDRFTHNLFDLIGMGTGGLRGRIWPEVAERVPAADERLLRYCGLIAQRPHSASALRGILRDYFAVCVEIDQCLGSWYDLEDSDRSYLSGELERNQLGVGAFIGEQVWDQQARFRLRVGPLTLRRFIDFLPDGATMSIFLKLTRYLVGQALSFDVQVFLKAAEVPFCRLTDEGCDAPRLGMLGWLKTDQFDADAGDAVFTWAT